MNNHKKRVQASPREKRITRKLFYKSQLTNEINKLIKRILLQPCRKFRNKNILMQT